MVVGPKLVRHKRREDVAVGLADNILYLLQADVLDECATRPLEDSIAVLGEKHHFGKVIKQALDFAAPSSGT